MRAEAGRAATGTIRGLDGLRAVAVLLVIAIHTALTTRLPWGVLGLLDPVVFSGQLGVDLFFALSGFLITTLILREEAGRRASGRPASFSLRDFYIRRALRILPPFYLVMTLLILVSGPAWLSTVRPTHEIAAEAPGALPSILTFWWNYYGTYVHPVEVGQAFVITWSLCIEEHFYLLWPATLLLAKGRRARVLIALGVCLGALALRQAAVLAGAPMQSLGGVTHFRLDAIMWGSLAALCRQEGWLPPSAWRRLATLVMLVLVGILLWHGDLLVSPQGTTLGRVYGLTAASILFTLVVLEVAQAPGSVFTRLLQLAPLAWMGRISYGMYLLHSPAIDLARLVTFRGPVTPSPGHFLLTASIAVAITTAAASFMFLCWERPFQGLRSRFRHTPLAR